MSLKKISITAALCGALVASAGAALAQAGTGDQQGQAQRTQPGMGMMCPCCQHMAMNMQPGMGGQQGSPQAPGAQQGR